MERWRRIDAAPSDEARALLRLCCGADRWVEAMMARRPFGSAAFILAAARDEWFQLPPESWVEAFGHHPRIGDRDAMRARFASTRSLSAQEQSGVSNVGDEVISALIEGNRLYEERFGYIFIVCASGKSAGEMLALLRARLQNEPSVELRVAAEEHAKICELRLTGQA
jgi:2-oxo-4-hydroxy-4-carboxy-5-ureidoimidazoline decarboxylase